MDRQKFSPIMPSLTDTPDTSLDRLLSPARHFKHPDEVLENDALDLWEKRAILSSWASDACAVESMPELRLPPGVARPVSFDRIMEALCKLDIDVSAPRSTPDEFRHDFARMNA
ncbi:hypothetical protein LB542_21230 [Mesorhizobium sp. BR1-1-9]|uniref:hypothetical protein n=1 Tax=unclassified Mesorhizobium TaxID=325217 RepID=UPI00112BB967|nr:MULTISPECIES: hypothetical protein [unclassified Mesorhizobium]MBZ9809577.1 hypothetical protein [Mesorhizobium sp. ESP-6-2]MBZ9873370.1 hypothetical protein [Mesorhizobium sp. BR1-1-9]MBZ9942482.1 hypothetical protein [Mesorhizobium sp. BR1-1-13]TPM28428.1 hypothetical protein FJ955_16385 [Mesorhizobium sp. B2-2-2]